VGIYREVTSRDPVFETTLLGDLPQAVDAVLAAAAAADDQARQQATATLEVALRSARRFTERLELEEQRSAERCVLATAQARAGRLDDAVRTARSIRTRQPTLLGTILAQWPAGGVTSELCDLLVACADHLASAQAAAALLAVHDVEEGIETCRFLLASDDG